ncbi:hypothetical protein N5079_19595 [Planotetraspora sp. A-T 1434]|uniref:hypothetical protein n=1 Tax=Planotetraspora sp. A-T 1434 TaxID=2979219 RepID=UPI0021C16D99|nr:hypothetical protein [Planotetraspora sp. A-T 1434]MCT9932408.1 hypothetical protein [Planotetraspora sp. A-T 1434]
MSNTDTRELPAATATGDTLAYSSELAARLAVLVEAEIARMDKEHEETKAQMRLMVADVEGRAGQPLDVLRLGRAPVGRDPYANAPEWADRTDERVQRITSIPDDGGEDDGEVA